VARRSPVPPGVTGSWRGRGADVARTYKAFLVTLARTRRGRGADSACVQGWVCDKNKDVFVWLRWGVRGMGSDRGSPWRNRGMARIGAESSAILPWVAQSGTEISSSREKRFPQGNQSPLIAHICSAARRPEFSGLSPEFQITPPPVGN